MVRELCLEADFPDAVRILPRLAFETVPGDFPLFSTTEFVLKFQLSSGCFIPGTGVLPAKGDFGEGGLKTLSNPIGAKRSRCSAAGMSPFTNLFRHSGVSCLPFSFFGLTCTVSCCPGWLDAFETDRKGDLPSIEGCFLRSEGGLGFGLGFKVSG